MIQPNRLTLDEAKRLTETDYVVDLRYGKVYHFGYVSGAGYCICYNPGERNMQDANAILPEELMQLDVDKRDLRSLADR